MVAKGCENKGEEAVIVVPVGDWIVFFLLLFFVLWAMVCRVLLLFFLVVQWAAAAARYNLKPHHHRRGGSSARGSVSPRVEASIGAQRGGGGWRRKMMGGWEIKNINRRRTLKFASRTRSGKQTEHEGRIRLID